MVEECYCPNCGEIKQCSLEDHVDHWIWRCKTCDKIVDTDYKDNEGDYTGLLA